MSGRWTAATAASAVLLLVQILPLRAGAATHDREGGVIVNSTGAFGGYTLFAPLADTRTLLVDMQGQIVHTWTSRYEPGQAVYLLDDGNLLHTARQPRNRYFEGGGIGGRIEKLAPDSKVLWSYVYCDADHCQHHDVEPLPNGHVLLIAWERKSQTDYLAAGGDPALLTGDELWPDSIVEVAPRGADGGEIVWEWHVWDHLVQQFDRQKPNYGLIAEHPGRVDLNFTHQAPRPTAAEIDRLRGLGYIGGGDGDGGAGGPRGHAPPGGGADWTHVNSVAYNPALDQIALSVHTFSEIWVIDHGTTTAEAAGHRGGRQGKGGDLLYRWGNPQAYGRGGPDDQQLFAQHDVHWIAEGLPGAGHLLAFNNGAGRAGPRYSTVVEIAAPVDAGGAYGLAEGAAFGPAEPAWQYAATPRSSFFSSHISGAQRLPNGDTLICSGEDARIFEVTAAGEVVWDFRHRQSERRPGPPGPRGFGPPPGNRPHPGDGRPPGGAPGGLFRATRLAPEAAGVQHLLRTIGKQP